MPTPKGYQQRLFESLQGRLAPLDIETCKEWEAFQRSSGLYSPRLDIALGPFSTTTNRSCQLKYDKLSEDLVRFTEYLMTCHIENTTAYRHPVDARVESALIHPTAERIRNGNRNARCFVAIEIENRGSRKHFLGGALNACALGRYGVLVGYTNEAVRTLVRLQAYWDFLRAVEKPTFSTSNLLVLSRSQMEAATRLIAAPPPESTTTIGE